MSKHTPDFLSLSAHKVKESNEALIAAERDRLKALVGELVEVVEEGRDAIEDYLKRYNLFMELQEQPRHAWFDKAEKALAKAKDIHGHPHP